MKILIAVVALLSSAAEAIIGPGILPGAVCCCTCMVPVPVPAPVPLPVRVPVPIPVRTPIMVPRPFPFPMPGMMGGLLGMGGMGGLGGMGDMSSCCCPCPQGMMGAGQQQVCTVVSPIQLQSSTTTAAPVGVPDIIKGPCGEIIIPLFNPPTTPAANGK